MNYQSNVDIDNIPNMENMNNMNNMNNMPNIPMQNSNNIPMQNSNNIPMQNSNNIPMQNPSNIPMQNSGGGQIQNPNNMPMQIPGGGRPINNPGQFKSQNNLEYAMKSIDDISFKGIDIKNRGGSNLSNNENLIKSITEEITNRLGEDKNLITSNINKNVKKDKSKDIKPQKKIDKDHMNNTDNVVKPSNFIEKIINYDDIKDGAILFVIFFLLSQDMIKDFFSEYITCIGADEEGKVNFKGVIIYGLILSILFLVVRKFI